MMERRNLYFAVVVADAEKGKVRSAVSSVHRGRNCLWLLIVSEMQVNNCEMADGSASDELTRASERSEELVMKGRTGL